MKNKIIGILIIGIIVTSGFGSLATAEYDFNKADEKNDFDYVLNEPDVDVVSFQNETQIKTIGPIAPVLNLAEVNILKGPYIKTFIIRLILSSLRAYFLLPNISFNVKDMTFIVHYKKNVPNIMFFNKFSYNTTVIDNGDEETFNKKHILVVSGFDGTFGFSRAKIAALTPAIFRFDGTCDDLIVAS